MLPRGFQGEIGRIVSMERPAEKEGPPIAVNDDDTASLFAERQSRIASLRIEGPRMLRAGNWRRAADLCRRWTDLEFWNAEPWRCLGYALQGQGLHKDAISAFRKAEQYDPGDRTLAAAIDRSQRGIMLEFMNRYRP
jgi:tetratricopeptide (TPR) repeat protein